MGYDYIRMNINEIEILPNVPASACPYHQSVVRKMTKEILNFFFFFFKTLFAFNCALNRCAMHASMVESNFGPVTNEINLSSTKNKKLF